MNNFELYNSTEIVFGEGVTERLGSLVPTNARVLVLFGEGSTKETGTIDEVKQALGEHKGATPEISRRALEASL